jgi:hypothetical protein
MCCALEDALQSHNVEWSADAMKVSCLAHVLNLSAKALLVGLDVTNEKDSNDDPLDLDKNLPELSPLSATHDVARIIIKICLSIVAYYLTKANNNFYSRYGNLVFLLPVLCNKWKHF